MDLPRNIRWLVRIFLPVEIAQTETNPTLGISRAWGWRSVLMLGIRRAGGWRIVLSFGIGRALGCGKVLSLGIRRGSRYVLGWPRSIGQRSILANWSQRSVLQPLQYSTGTEVVR